MDVVVVSDTHLRGGLDSLPGRLLRALERADAALHAGDVVSPQAWRELRDAVDLHAVLGNNDRELKGLLPERARLELAGVKIALVHDSGPSVGRAGRLARWFPDADLVVFGHSHMPVNEGGVGDQWLFNPGSPTQRRLQSRHTFGRLRLDGGRIRRREIVPLD